MLAVKFRAAKKVCGILCVMLFAMATISGCEKPEEQTSLYDYEKLFSFHTGQNETLTDSHVEIILDNLAYPKVLPIESWESATDPFYNLILRYSLGLSEGQEYTIDNTLIARDSILIFTLIEDLYQIDYNFVQDDYSAVFTITREKAEDILREPTYAYGMDRDMFTEELSAIIEELSYMPDNGFIVTYEHIYSRND